MPQKLLLLVIARRLGLVVLLAFAFEGLDLLSGIGPPTGASPPQSSSHLREIVASGRLADLHWPDFSDYKTQVTEFYESSTYATAWLNGRQPSAQALALIEL